MVKYTDSDIICDIQDPRIKGAIGKECYCGFDWEKLLLNANKDTGMSGILQSIDTRAPLTPFHIINPNINGLEYCPYIILKDKDITSNKYETSTLYVPFESIEEFIDGYGASSHFIKYNTVGYSISNYGGMWLKYKGDNMDSYHHIDKICRDGITIGSDDIIGWNTLFEMYEFLDGTPCGKLNKEISNG